MVQHLAQDHVGEGGVVVVEEGLNFPLHAAQELALVSGVLGLDGVGGVHDRLEGLFVPGFLDIQLAVGLGGEDDFLSPARQEAVRLVVEAVGAAGLHSLPGPLIGHLSGEEQDGDFLLGLLEGEDVAGLHHQQAHVHLGAHVVGGRVDVGVVALLEFGVFVKIGHWNHLPNCNSNHFCDDMRVTKIP